MISTAVLAYAASAFASAASAGLFEFAVETATLGDPVTGILNAAGSIALIIGLLLATLALGLLAWGFVKIRAETPRAGAEIRAYLARVRPLLSAAYVALVIAAILGTEAFLIKGAFSLFSGPALLASAAAAFLFMAAVLIPAAGLARKPGPGLAWSATVLGAVGIIGHTIMGLRFLGSVDGEFDWLTFGGFPLINWNLPFGIVVGVGGLLMWAAFRFVPTPSLGAPSRDPAEPSQGPSP